ncbi:MAG: YbaN family protein [Thermodesulfobacteriota bacterium]|nr:YbaN family protein [Thermodesulfobacteriota bacterium]
MRLFYFILGLIFFCVGFVGVCVPVVPTTPFMLLALWGFSRSSPRFHNWLYTHKVFGPPLQKWHDHQVIPLAAKYFALFFMTASLVYLYVFLITPIWLNLVISATIAYGCWFILTKPSYPPEELSCKPNLTDRRQKT